MTTPYGAALFGMLAFDQEDGGKPGVSVVVSQEGDGWVARLVFRGLDLSLHAFETPRAASLDAMASLRQLWAAFDDAIERSDWSQE